MAITILRFIIGFFMAVFAIVILAVCVGAAVLPFFHADIGAQLAADDRGISPVQAILLIEGVLLGIAVLLGMAEYFFLLLWRILASVKDGDPFTPANSIRLSRMAWTALVGDILSIGFAVYVAWAQTYIADAIDGEDLNFDSGGAGIVLILVLFVLARVFREGTEMRAELEGTV
ncbi:DUF2975 domain-containing protein [Croceibacterium aestuarii]|uniref:DUF2975 domain-containing protein n=1 Tax=Croceibacterium aestuarii TaxID=3064139 RepID=UPI00272EC647|nr:DUF2975 domain-containing protein [Croceibacterium sp. D39]